MPTGVPGRRTSLFLCDLSAVIDDPSADNGTQYLRRRNLIRRNCRNIPVQDDQIRKLPYFQRPNVLVLVKLIGSIESNRLNHRRLRETRVTSEPAGVFRRCVRTRLACDANLKREPLVKRVNRPVTAVGDARALRCDVTGRALCTGTASGPKNRSTLLWCRWPASPIGRRAPG